MSFERCEKQRNPVHLQRICGVYIHANNDTEKRIIVRNYYIMPVIFCQQYCHYYQQKITAVQTLYRCLKQYAGGLLFLLD